MQLFKLSVDDATVELLLRYKADPLICSIEGRFATLNFVFLQLFVIRNGLFIAAERGSNHILRLLFELGALPVDSPVTASGN